MSPELLQVSNSFQLNEKSDIFSLGLSILEIICRIDLPLNGEGWRFIRSGNFILTKEYFNNSNLREVPSDMIKLIEDMIQINPNERNDLIKIIEEHVELNMRYQNLISGTYSRNVASFANRTRSLSDYNKLGKRSDSFKSSIF
jgi:serine/threonine protein kinase